MHLRSCSRALRAILSAGVLLVAVLSAIIGFSGPASAHSSGGSATTSTGTTGTSNTGLGTLLAGLTKPLTSGLAVTVNNTGVLLHNTTGAVTTTVNSTTNALSGVLGSLLGGGSGSGGSGSSTPPSSAHPSSAPAGPGSAASNPAPHRKPIALSPPASVPRLGIEGPIGPQLITSAATSSQPSGHPSSIGDGGNTRPLALLGSMSVLSLVAMSVGLAIAVTLIVVGAGRRSQRARSN